MHTDLVSIKNSPLDFHVHWATPLKIYTPPVEDFQKIVPYKECEFSKAPT